MKLFSISSIKFIPSNALITLSRLSYTDDCVKILYVVLKNKVNTLGTICFKLFKSFYISNNKKVCR